MSDSSTWFGPGSWSVTEAATTEVSYEARGVGKRHTVGGKGAGPSPGAGERVAGSQPPAVFLWGSLEQERCSL